MIKRAVVCGLARAGAKDIDRAAEALQHAERRRIHTFISTSPLHMKFKLQHGAGAGLRGGHRSVTQARNHTDDVEWSPRTRRAPSTTSSAACVEAAIKAGATTINIPDTVGYTMPEEYCALIRMLMRARAERRQGGLLDPLPQRPGPGGRQLARRRRGRRAADRMHHQRPRRARRQRGAGRDRDGAQDARRRAALLHRHRDADADAGLEAGLGGHRPSRCSTTRRSSARTPSPTRPASTRTAC